MKTAHHHLVFHFLLSWLLLLCYLLMAHSAATNRTNIKCVDHERDALLTFKRGITSDTGRMLTSWDEKQDCCLWHGIRCNNRTGHVIELHLHRDLHAGDHYYLTGKIDPSLFELKHLSSLDLSYNNFSESSIPKSIQFLTNLKHLQLQGCSLSGEIPHELGNLSKLATLDLSYNDFTRVKSLEWLSRLTLLRDFDLSWIDLSAVPNLVQIINHLSNLRVLCLLWCQLSETNLSLSDMNSSLPLRVIDFSSNSLGGLIPGNYWNMHSLSSLTLNDNNFEGFSFSNSSSLRDINFANNRNQDSFPKLFNNLSNLKTLDLSYNRFFDDLSNVILALLRNCANEPPLERLDLSGNFLWGSIPDMITKFSSLKELNLDSNELNGTITKGVGQLSKLESLTIKNNFLKGTIYFNHFLNLSRLTNLILSNNRLEVLNASEDWIPPFQLNRIGLASCKLGPSFPKWLLTQRNISYVDISNNNISDSIPATFWTKSSANTIYFNVSHNKFVGSLPNFSTNLHNFYTVDLSFNYFEGTLPFFLLGPWTYNLYLNDNLFSNSTHLLCSKTPTQLRILDLSNNLLSGDLLDCWMKFESLESLHLENNRISGNIPSSIGTLIRLYYLHLENNSFSGELPKSLENCTSLLILNLQYNSLTGYIPSSIGYAYKSLSILNLRGNNFYGRLPLSLCQLSHLQILDLANNHLTGTIPDCIHNFTAMLNDSYSLLDEFDSLDANYIAYSSNKVEATIIMWKEKEQIFGKNKQLVALIDLSCNELQGKIPNGISSLTRLESVNLSANNLTGSIPSNIGNLVSLEVLDLSNNHLSGELPTSLANLAALDILNVANNNLSGRIPTSTQLQSFDTSSYKGNSLLCGAPLPYCAGDGPPPKTISRENQQGDQDNNNIYPGLYISSVLGFIIGFWGVCGTLVVKTSWRLAFFSIL